MLKKLIYRFLRPHHFWRDIGFDELSELYASMMLRSLAISLVGIFIPVYLLKLDYGLAAVLAFYGVLFTARIVGDILGGYTVARMGPKHSIIIASILQIISLLLLVTLPSMQWPLAFIASCWGVASSLFFIAFHVDFSKVKHVEHGGKEVSLMNIVERIGGTLGPLAGGVVAALFGPGYTFVMAIILFAAGLIPLFMTGEPTRIHQQLDFKGLPVQRLKRDLVSFAALGVENQISVALWPMFMTLFVFRDNTYAQIGLVTSLAVLMSIVAARAVGKLIDDHKGRTLLHYGASANIALHLVRPLMGTFVGVLAVNLINEVVTVAYRLPYTKGMYDAADQLLGHRIVYIVSMEAVGNIIKATVFWLLCLSGLLLTNFGVLACGFGIAAIASGLIMVEKFAALNGKRLTL